MEWSTCHWPPHHTLKDGNVKRSVQRNFEMQPPKTKAGLEVWKTGSGLVKTPAFHCKNPRRWSCLSCKLYATELIVTQNGSTGQLIVNLTRAASYCLFFSSSPGTLYISDKYERDCM